MNAEVQNIFNQQAIEAALEAAVSGYQAKNPQATEADIALKRAEVLQSIMSSRTKDKFLNSKANRAARKAHVVAEAEKLGVQFHYATEKVLVPMEYSREHTPFRIGHPFLSALFEELFDVLRISEVVDRTVTFACKKEPVDAGWVKFVFSLSAQNPHDEEDGLVGREYAISRFANGQTTTVYIPDSFIRGYFDVAIKAGVVETYLRKYDL